MTTSTATSQCSACGADISGTRFCESCGAPVTTDAPAPRRVSRRLVTVVVAAAAGALLLIAGAAIAVSVLGAAPTAPAAAPVVTDGTPTPEPTATESTPQPTEPAPAAATAPPLPAGCESVFSPAMATQLQGYGVVLNPSWAQIELADSYSFDDALLVDFMSQRSNLQCLWVSPNGGSGVGIETRIIPLTAEEAASVQARLSGLGYTPISELGGTRYVFGVSGSETGAAYGESHIVVGGYWFATSWLELGITGYTADMVTTLLG